MLERPERDRQRPLGGEADQRMRTHAPRGEDLLEGAERAGQSSQEAELVPAKP
jgi:hypothetical protein